jgi:HPt (histidine-containing phosphotransfer) domain-containing protein
VKFLKSKNNLNQVIKFRGFTMIDLEILKQAFSNDESLILETLSNIKTSVPAHTFKIISFLRNNQTAKLKFEAHTLKGILAILNLTDFKNFCFELEKIGESGQIKDAEEQITKINQFSKQLIQDIDEHINVINKNGL